MRGSGHPYGLQSAAREPEQLRAPCSAPGGGYLMQGLLSVHLVCASGAVRQGRRASTGPIVWLESVVRGERYLYSIDLSRRPLPTEHRS